MGHKLNDSQTLAAAITRAASKQTYTTIRLLVDRGRSADAFRAYAYFRWVDDVLDEGGGTPAEKGAFLSRQQALLEDCYRAAVFGAVSSAAVSGELCAEEWMLVDLVRSDTEPDSGLRAYLFNMMAVMRFDVERRGRVISQAELSEYSRLLATAVTEALHHFIGHGDPARRGAERYLAVTAAHITHMLRDALEDAQAGYFNIPGEALQARRISAGDLQSRAYREWVCRRVQLAHCYFAAGRAYLAQVKSLRCRLAGYAYIARFEYVLGLIARDAYCLRCAYPERKTLRAALWMGWRTLASACGFPWLGAAPGSLAVQPLRVDKR